MCQRRFPPPPPRCRIPLPSWGAPFPGSERLPGPREGQRTRPLRRGPQAVPTQGRDTGASPPAGSGTTIPRGPRAGERPARLWTPPGTLVPAWAPRLGHLTRPTPPFFDRRTGRRRLGNARGRSQGGLLSPWGWGAGLPSLRPSPPWPCPSRSRRGNSLPGWGRHLGPAFRSRRHGAAWALSAARSVSAAAPRPSCL